jgi:type I restriction enzyme, S subunit
VTAVERVRVGEVLSLERREVPIDPEHEYQLVGVYSFGKGIFHRDPKPGAELGDYRFFRIEPGDLVLSNIQAWEGAIAFATAADDGTIGTHRFLSYVAVDDRIDTNWARWFFLSEPGMEGIRRAAPGTAVRNRTLAVKRFEDLMIPLPPIDVQRRVATRLDRVTEVAARLSARIARAEALTRAIQVSLASGGGDSLDGWAETRLGDVLALSDAQITVEADAEYRIAGVYSFGRGLIDRGLIAGSETSYKTLTRLNDGDIIVSKLNGWEGAVAIIDERYQDAYVSGEFPTFVVDRSRMLPGFFRGVARSPAFWDVLNHAVRGSMVRRRRISATDFMRATIPLPSLETQARISRAIDELDHAREKSSRSAARVDALTQAVLNREFGTVA